MSSLWTSMTIALGNAAGQWGAALTRHMPLLFTALVVVLAAWWLSRVVSRTIRRVLARTSTTGSVDLLVARLAKAAVMMLGVGVALGIMGVNASALVASLGLVGLTVGLALREVLSDYFAGVLLLLHGPFKPGDSVVIDGIEGVVLTVTARSTTLRAGDGRVAFVPNSVVFASTVVNVSIEPLRRFEVVVRASAGGDGLEALRETVERALQDTAGVLAEPAGEAHVTRVSGTGVTVVGRGWFDSRETTGDAVQSAALIEISRRTSGEDHGVRTLESGSYAAVRRANG